MQLEIVDWEQPFKNEQVYEGIERRVLSFTDRLMLVHYTIKEGAVFPEHVHEDTHQAVFIVEGGLDLFGDRSATLSAGDSFVVGPGVRHGIRGTAERTTLIDAFAPPIEEYSP